MIYTCDHCGQFSRATETKGRCVSWPYDNGGGDLYGYEAVTAPCIGFQNRCVFTPTIRNTKHLREIRLKHLAIIGKVVMVSRVYGRKAHKSRTNLEALAVSC